MGLFSRNTNSSAGEAASEAWLAEQEGDTKKAARYQAQADRYRELEAARDVACGFRSNQG